MKNSIYKRTKRQVLFISAVAALSVCATAVFYILYLRTNIVNNSEMLGRSASVDNRQSLEVQMEDSLLHLADSKAEISDEKLSYIVDTVSVLAQSVADLLSRPDHFNPEFIAFPSSINAGHVVAQLRLAGNVEQESVEDEIGLLANLSHLMVTNFEVLEHVSSLYISTETGISISADRDSHLKEDIYDPRSHSRYQRAIEAESLVWTDVYADSAGRGLSITCLVPFTGPDGEVHGVAGADILLDLLMEVVTETAIGETGYAFIANEHGDMIVSTTLRVDHDNNLVTVNLSEFLTDDTVERVLNRSSGIDRGLISGENNFIAFSPLSTLPWNFVIVKTVREVVLPAIETEAYIISTTMDTVNRINLVVLITFGVFLVALIITFSSNFLLARRLASSLTKPIIKLNDGAKIVGSGNLSYRLDVKTGDELEMLSNTLNAMIDSIKSITTDKEHSGAELDVATNIRESILPRVFPAFPHRPEFDIYAVQLPTKEVYGDFYDFFLIDEHKLAVVIADVSDRGVPAALFMVVAKTLIKNTARLNRSPKEIFDFVNSLLFENNDVMMSATAFLGIYDIFNSTLTYVNAGHTPPLIRHGDGYFDQLDVIPGYALGSAEGTRYQQDEVALSNGDMLYLYTDGITEATNLLGEAFSVLGLLSVINENRDKDLRGIQQSVISELDSFTKGVEQTDDITMLILRIEGDDTPVIPGEFFREGNGY